ncbi:hypothetical protein CFC21_000236 [Triticum aestivum]|uniref:Uncharacterized protein n=1 Tax=Triticum aestivum TaxID=4565 RepID=A0A3B5XTD7_WHEAT|nr:hypothetical protein CFC21_000236 [Triticum aestivum]
MSISAPLEDEDLLREIFLRLPPLPSTLSRASLVCTRWRRILSDPRFLRRFSRHHPEPPLLGFFKGSRLRYSAFTPILDLDPPDRIPAESFFVRFLHRLRRHPPLGFSKGSLAFTSVFTPVLDPPNRIPAQRLFVPEHGADWELHGCRHGLAVMLSESLCEVFVWDPLNGQQHRVPFPPELRHVKRESFCLCSATVMCADDQDGHVHQDYFLSPAFKLVLICTSRDLKTSFACVYDSASDVWENIVSTSTTDMVLKLRPGILIRETVYWLFHGREILAFDTKRRTLRVIEIPAEAQHVNSWSFQLLRTDDDSVLGLAVMSKPGIHIWERKLNSDGLAGWVVMQKINQLEGIFSCALRNAEMVGYDEELNVMILSTYRGDFMLHLKSMQISLISKPNKRSLMAHFPYRNFYTAGRGVGWKWVDPNF